MATKLQRPVRREVAVPRFRGRDAADRWIVTVKPEGITMREWRRHGSLPTVPWSRVLLIAAQLGAEELRRERAARRAERRAKRVRG